MVAGDDGLVQKAQRLGLNMSMAITDPALLLTEIVPRRPVPQTGMVSFMPHHGSVGFADWKNLCRQAGINYIDPSTDINEVLFQIRQSRLVIAEAMHAAIVADAFRVPWIAVACYDHILDFKWDDWCQSLQMPYTSHKIPTIFDMERGFSCQQSLKNTVKRGLQGAGVWNSHWTPPVPRTNKAAVEAQVVAALMSLAAHGAPSLSDERHQKEVLDRLLNKLDEVRRDMARRGQQAPAAARSA